MQQIDRLFTARPELGVERVCQELKGPEQPINALTLAIKTYLYRVLWAFQKLVAMHRDGLMRSVYSLRDDLYRHTQRTWVHDFA